MNDKRDEVIEELDKFLIERYGKTVYAPSVKAYTADFALSREAELRRQIADDLQEHFLIEGSTKSWKTYFVGLAAYIEKLRGNK